MKPEHLNFFINRLCHYNDFDQHLIYDEVLVKAADMVDAGDVIELINSLIDRVKQFPVTPSKPVKIKRPKKSRSQYGINVTAVAAELGITTGAIYSRLSQGMTLEEATDGGRFALPRKVETYEYQGECLSLPDWSRKTGIPYGTIYRRLARGWSLGQVLELKTAENQQGNGSC